MSYRNKTYVVFDGDNDQWAYRYMRGWKSNENIAFNFHDAHDVGSEITDRASEETVKRRLRERFSTAKQVVVLIGEQTRNLFRFVRWELEVSLDLDLPIIAVHLKEAPNWFDGERLPPIIRNEYVVHIPFRARIIQYALDNFPAEYAQRVLSEGGPRFYPDELYLNLEIDLAGRRRAGQAT